MSGSMRPTLSYGSLVFTKEAAFDDIKLNDILTFKSEKNKSKFFTHRVVGIDTEGRSLETKGDANKTPDPYNAPDASIEGKVVFSLPVFGLPLAILKNPSLRLIVIIFLLIGLSAEIAFFQIKKMERRAG